ncbi:MAG: SgcJ/EcaC family oxidoreductase [Pararhodobacter sp.]|nr:SgcJ/EcaC family oxidoreductase [Pararhodobacter sp.]
MPMTAKQAVTSPDETEIMRLFDDWNEALKSLDPARVAALYAPDAILLPTVSNRVRHNTAEIEDYFVRFLAKAPVGRIHESNIRLMGDVAVHSGIYVFRMTREAGTGDVPARFSFVYQRIGGAWKIVEHHSSYMPERGAW